ncbi:sensor histidine kinase [Clostridium estertheticum]|uniref:histidine kinase n=1 Tax=Clostridium estertheticum TaxID=238834 RepID=A0A7Y3STN1_9CLOT|nr:HAMP domain-containing sensor histidine kinase [Clostridium estertheticum]MBX4259526.1 HAMP domain-containing histidine kinase [Clostridium estertheticum]NNU75159.1 HAMP domain-containing histidine kinase [Clostridium estertheticum]WBL48368.1 HAMP domain-containing histidine kinase [Clostridium estertheticum]WLC70820.1 HAMP domain-containing histidine kinase [Clostridium estertheticum]
MEIKKISLQGYTIKFIFKIGLSSIMFLFVIFLIFSYMANSGILLSANHSQQLIEKAKTNIKNAKQVTPELIPENLKYVILDKQTLKTINGTMNKSETEKAKINVKNHQLGTNVYEVIERPESYCVIHYQLIVQFANPIFQRLIPYPEITIFAIFIVILLIALYALSLQFSNKIKKELNKFSLITEKIQQQDLDFEVQPTCFVEHQKVMDSLDSLRHNLKKSLTYQFEQEKNKQEQISSLAHDIKIPITIIKGNAELLILTQKDENALDYANEIIGATSEIEEYTQLLIDTSQNDQIFTMHKERNNINEFLNIIQKDTLASIGNRDICFGLNNHMPKEVIWSIDYSSMKRTFMNIIINALEYTPNETSLNLEVSLKDNLASFVITDSGKGFSSEALKKATEMFYTNNKSRSQTGHYGIGLAFADKVIKVHNGTLRIQNDIYTGGGQIVILLPVELPY